MTDLPEELARVPENRELGNVLGRVFGGAHLVAFNHKKGLVAVWYGGTGFNVYDARAWADGETGEVYHFNVMACADDGETSLQQRLNAAKVELANYGFDVADMGGNQLEA